MSRVWEVQIRAAEKAGHSNPASLRAYLVMSRSEGHAERIDEIELTRALESKVQRLKRQLDNLKGYLR
jgi:hypothetical protein